MVKSHVDLICAAGNDTSEAEGERRIWDNFYFLAWVNDPALTKKKPHIKTFNYRQVQLEARAVYLSGNDPQVAVPVGLKCRPCVKA